MSNVFFKFVWRKLADSLALTQSVAQLKTDNKHHQSPQQNSICKLSDLMCRETVVTHMNSVKILSPPKTLLVWLLKGEQNRLFHVSNISLRVLSSIITREKGFVLCDKYDSNSLFVLVMTVSSTSKILHSFQSNTRSTNGGSKSFSSGLDWRALRLSPCRANAR